jgi:hypothetical protein
MRIGSPAGKTIADAGAGFFRMAIGKVAEGWVLGDLLSLLRQLGRKNRLDFAAKLVEIAGVKHFLHS